MTTRAQFIRKAAYLRNLEEYYRHQGKSPPLDIAEALLYAYDQFNNLAPIEQTSVAAAIQRERSKQLDTARTQQHADLLAKAAQSTRRGTEGIAGLKDGLTFVQQHEVLNGKRTVKVDTGRAYVAPKEKIDAWTKKDFGGLTRGQLDRFEELRNTNPEKFHQDANRLVKGMDARALNRHLDQWKDTGFRLSLAEKFSEKDDNRRNPFTGEIQKTPHEETVQLSDGEIRKVQILDAVNKHDPDGRLEEQAEREAHPARYDDEERDTLSAAWDYFAENPDKSYDDIKHDIREANHG